MQAHCSRVWPDLFDNVDKDKVIFNRCPGGGHRILQAREAKVRGVHLSVSTVHPSVIICSSRRYASNAPWLAPPRCNRCQLPATHNSALRRRSCCPPRTLPPPPRAFGRTKSLRLGLDSSQHCCLIAGGIPGQPAGKIGRCSAPLCS